MSFQRDFSHIIDIFCMEIEWLAKFSGADPVGGCCGILDSLFNVWNKQVGYRIYTQFCLIPKRPNAETVRCHESRYTLVMGDSAKQKTIRFDSIRFIALSESPPQSTPGVLDSDSEAAGPVNRSHDRPARIATELLLPLHKRVATLTRM